MKNNIYISTILILSLTLFACNKKPTGHFLHCAHDEYSDFCYHFYIDDDQIKWHRTNIYYTYSGNPIKYDQWNDYGNDSRLRPDFDRRVDSFSCTGEIYKKVTTEFLVIYGVAFQDCSPNGTLIYDKKWDYVRFIPYINRYIDSDTKYYRWEKVKDKAHLFGKMEETLETQIKKSK